MRLALGMLRGVVLAVVARRRRRVGVVVLALVVLSSGAVLHWAEVGSRGGWIRTGCWRTRSYNKKGTLRNSVGNCSGLEYCNLESSCKKPREMHKVLLNLNLHETVNSCPIQQRTGQALPQSRVLPLGRR